MNTRERERLIRAGFCPCDPTRGQSCRNCDGTAADEREAWIAARQRDRARR